MKRALGTMAAFVALAATAPAQASVPVPWCGTDVSAVDRQPDAMQAYSIHVAYVRAPGAPDRFAEWAPRIVGDVTAIDAWWRREDPTRALRFDTFPAAGCPSALGALDLSSVQLTRPLGAIDIAFNTLQLLLFAEAGFDAAEKAYLVYFDGPTGQVGDERVCGQGSRGGRFAGARFPGLAVVYLDSCGAEPDDRSRPVVAVHELAHVFGAVDRDAPNACAAGHVCDVTNDLLNAELSGNDLELHVLDVNRDDYYAHAGTWTDVRTSLFLEPLDSPDRSPPAAPRRVRVSEAGGGMAHISWWTSSDDVGPVRYRIYQGTSFLLEEVTGNAALTLFAGKTTEFGVRAVDAAGRLSPLVLVRFRRGVGMVDASGRLVWDTVPPPAVRPVTVRRDGATVRLSWRAPRDAGGIRSYRVGSAGRTTVVRKPAVALAVSRLRGAVTITAVDRAGNIGPATTVPARRLR